MYCEVVGVVRDIQISYLLAGKTSIQKVTGTPSIGLSQGLRIVYTRYVRNIKESRHLQAITGVSTAAKRV